MLELRAVIWDYDGTLANSWERNYSVTREIMRTVLERDPDSIEALTTLGRYSNAMTRWINWRDFYSEGLGLSEDDIDRVGPCWTPFQNNNTTPVQFYEDAEASVRALADYPQGIVSQNAKSAITIALERSGLLPYFRCIIGYEEVPIRRQKPDPEGLLICIEELLGRAPGRILFIGDHVTDVQCALNASQALNGKSAKQDVVSGVFVRDSGPNTANWDVKPDLELHGESDIVSMIRDLGHNQAKG